MLLLLTNSKLSYFDEWKYMISKKPTNHVQLGFGNPLLPVSPAKLSKASDFDWKLREYGLYIGEARRERILSEKSLFLLVPWINWSGNAFIWIPVVVQIFILLSFNIFQLFTSVFLLILINFKIYTNHNNWRAIILWVKANDGNHCPPPFYVLQSTVLVWIGQNRFWKEQNSLLGAWLRFINVI